MEAFCKCIEDQKVEPILIKNKGKHHLTLYYYDEVLHRDDKHILYFGSTQDMEAFCERNELQIDNELCEYDFDAPIKNPVDYGRILNNWNLLNTIAATFGMYFEGDCKKYTPLYDLLFKLNLPVEPIPPTYQMSEKQFKYILKVFRKKERFLNRFELYQEQ